MWPIHSLVAYQTTFFHKDYAEKLWAEGLARIEGEAREKSANLEYEIFIRIREEVGKYPTSTGSGSRNRYCRCLARLTAWLEKKPWLRPEFGQDSRSDIKMVVMLVVEKVMGAQTYIPIISRWMKTPASNWSQDLTWAGSQPTMRQLAITAVFMAQEMGSCSGRRVPIFDAIFTRIGAADDLVSGQSTFMK